MANLITWEKSFIDSLELELTGFTKYDIQNDEVYTYIIRNKHLYCCASKCGNYKSIRGTKFASLEDAKQAAELIEKGRQADE